MEKKLKNFFKLFFAGVIPIMVIVSLINGYFKEKKDLQKFQFQIQNGKVFYDLDTKNFINRTKLDIKQVVLTNDPEKLANSNKTYRFGLINNSDTIYYNILPSYNSEIEYYLFSEKDDFLIGKYTIK